MNKRTVTSYFFEEKKENHVSAFLERGHVTIPSVLSAQLAESIASHVLHEALLVALEGEDVEEIEKKIQQAAMKPSMLLNDSRLRGRFCHNPNCVWRGGDPNKPHVSKNTGMVNVYHNPMVRQHVLFNEQVYRNIAELYGALLPKVPAETQPIQLVYLLGPDRVNVKAQGAVDMPRHLDKHLLFPNQSGTFPHRIQAFCCLRLDSSKSNNTSAAVSGAGSIEVLEGFHRVFDLASFYFDRNRGSLAAKARTDFVPQQLGQEFDAYLPKFLDWLQTVVAKVDLSDVTEKEAQQQEGKQDATAELRRILRRMLDQGCISQPAELVKLANRVRWTVPAMRAGDLFCWDQRLPHRNLRNKTATERIVAYVSLFPRTYLEQQDQERVGIDIRGMFLGKVQGRHSGSNRDNDRERLLFKETWTQRVEWTDTDVSRKVLNEDEKQSGTRQQQPLRKRKRKR